MEQLLAYLYDFHGYYINFLFEPGILNYGLKFIGTILYFMFSQSILLYFGIYFTFIDYVFYFIDNGSSVIIFGKSINVMFYHLIIGSFLILFLLNILTYFVGRFFGRNIEKKHSNKLNYYIIFFHFFPIVGFLGNFIVGKNFKISFLNLLLKNFLFLVVIFFYCLFFLYIGSFIGGSMFYIVLFIIFPILIGICSYFYYFKFKKN